MGHGIWTVYLWLWCPLESYWRRWWQRWKQQQPSVCDMVSCKWHIQIVTEAIISANFHVCSCLTIASCKYYMCICKRLFGKNALEWFWDSWLPREFYLNAFHCFYPIHNSFTFTQTVTQFFSLLDDCSLYNNIRWIIHIKENAHKSIFNFNFNCHETYCYLFHPVSI